MEKLLQVLCLFVAVRHGFSHLQTVFVRTTAEPGVLLELRASLGTSGRCTEALLYEETFHKAHKLPFLVVSAFLWRLWRDS